MNSPRSNLQLTILLFAAFLSAPSCAHAQEEIKGMPAEPADAQEVRDQILFVAKISDGFPDQGGALYFLAWAKQHLRETREALVLLKECVALQDGFDPSGSPEFYGLKGTPEFDALVERVHRDFPVVAQAHEAFRTVEKDLIPE